MKESTANGKYKMFGYRRESVASLGLVSPGAVRPFPPPLRPPPPTLVTPLLAGKLLHSLMHLELLGIL